MILDQINELRDSIKSLTEALDFTYSNYVKYFPAEVQRISDLKVAVEMMESAKRTMVSEPNENDESKIEHKPDVAVELSDSKELMVVAQPELSSDREDDETLGDDSNEESAAVRQLEFKRVFRKCLQLCHPDKCKRFDSTTRLKLYDLFHEVKELEGLYHYASQLATFYVMIRVIRGEAHLLTPEQQMPMKRELHMLEQDYNQLLHHPVCKVLYFHREGQLYTAKTHFREFLDTSIHDLESQLKGA